MQDRETIRFLSHRLLCDMDISGDISTHGITQQVLVPGFWKMLFIQVTMCHVQHDVTIYSKHILHNDNSLMSS